MPSHLVLGGSGFLGRYLLRELGERGLGTFASHPFEGGLPFDASTQTFSDLVAHIPRSVSHVFILYGVINPDFCAREPEASRAINVTGMLDTIRAIFERGMVPVFMSTDYVFDGTRGQRTEDEDVSPTTAYGRQKAEVEAWLATQNQHSIICRSSKIVSGDTNVHSVLGQWAADIKNGVAMRCADDQFFSPGFVQDIARGMIELAEGGARGIFHVAGPEPFSRFDLAKLLVDEVRRVAPTWDIHLHPCKLADIPFAEPRPLNTALSVAKLQSHIGFDLTTMGSLCRRVAEQHFG